MAEENIVTAARRIIRFVRIDDVNNGGLLSLDTILAAEALQRQVEAFQYDLQLSPSLSTGPIDPGPAALAEKESYDESS